MYSQLYQRDNLINAFIRVKHNKGGSGIDRVSIAQFERNLGTNIRELQRLLETERYQPLPVKRVYIPKSNGKKRPLGIPAVRDRVVQQALLHILEPVFEPLFADSSFGFRPHRSALQAIHQVQAHLDQGHEYIVDADIRDFFGTLDQQLLMDKVRLHIKERPILALIWKFLCAGIMEEGKVRTATAGTPQGGIISPLLANIYLNDFDHSLGKTSWKLVRYADDFVILCATVNQAVQAMKTIRAMTGRLHLSLAEEKTGITEYRKGFDFLGYQFHQYYGNYKWPSHKSLKAFKDKVRATTRRQQPINAALLIPRLNPIILGWGNYFKYGNVNKRFTELDGWVRMRLRSFIEKKKWPSGMNWKYPKDHFARLRLVSLTSLLESNSRQLSFADMAQPYRRAVCGKSARTVR